LRVDLAHDVTHGAALAGGVHPLQDQQQAALAPASSLGEEPLLQVGQAWAEQVERGLPVGLAARRSRAWPWCSIALRSTGPAGSRSRSLIRMSLGRAALVSFADVFGMVMIVSARTRLGQWGCWVGSGSVTSLQVWAPAARSVAALVDGSATPLEAAEGGWWRADVPAAGHGADYAFVVDGDQAPLPDPRSAWQPHGVHGASRVYDHGPVRLDRRLVARGRRLPGSVVYELHVGTFTADGTLDAALERLDHLVSLGVDLVELMPVAAFPGRHGWGYDGVHLFAVHEPYGGPDALKRFVDACHARGLGVCLDVVYNHLGPSGNYLPRFGPYFTGKHATPWGMGINLDDEGAAEVRRWVIDNALMWLRDYHLDALRLDAVHALADDSPVHLLAELSREVDALSCAVRRPLTLIAESDLNLPSTVTPVEGGGAGHDGAVERRLPPRPPRAADRRGAGLLRRLCGRAVRGAGADADRGVLPRGDAVDVPGVGVGQAGRPGAGAGVAFPGVLADPRPGGGTGRSGTGWPLVCRLDLPGWAAALVLTSPVHADAVHGRGVGGVDAWQYFTSHEEPELAEAVREGRRREFAAHGWGGGGRPGPSVLVDGGGVDAGLVGKRFRQKRIRGCWTGNRSLISLRRAEPSLSDPRRDLVSVTYDAEARWWW
jgi:maltooligosyltrehalose trehalohydrolase